MNAYRQQQLAIAAAIDSGDYNKASDLLRQDIRTFAQPEPIEQPKPKRKQKNKLLRILYRLLK